MKYKVGDKVRVREDLVVDEEYDGEYFVENMTQYRGKIVTIDRAVADELEYLIKDDNHSCLWTDSMFEPLESENSTDEANISDEWVLCKDDTESHADSTEAAVDVNCLLEAKFKEAVGKITPDELKEILLKKIEDSVENMSDDVVQDILEEALC